jgi:hypothetical protein
VFSNATGGSANYTLNYFEPEGVSMGSVLITDYFAPQLHSIQPGQKLTFRVAVAEKAESTADFSQKYVWRITGARGFRSVGK